MDTDKDGYLYADKTAKSKDVAVWAFEKPNIANVCYMYTKDLNGVNHWLSQSGAYLVTTSNTKERKAAKMDLGSDLSETIKSTIIRDDKCLTIST